MALTGLSRTALTATLLIALGACGNISGGSNPLGSLPGIGSIGLGGEASEDATRQAARTRGAENVAVNRYLWAASLDVLSFLPIESVDPFTGVIVFGYGRPPGGGRAYRGTVHISDPALDARSNVALATSGGPVSTATQHAVEDAILARARQIRTADGKL